jgi:hypothetical protein
MNPIARSGNLLTFATERLMQTRAVARTIRDSLRSSLRRIQLRSALSSLERVLDRNALPDSQLMKQLVQSWGNEAWSASEPFLNAILQWLPRTQGAIVECGSGLSTLMLGVAASKSARIVCSLENDPDWEARVRAAIPERVRPSVRLLSTPIRSYGDFDWYTTEGKAIPAQIGFVICDGPPGSTRGGRYGLVPVLEKAFAPGCIVLLDDTQRDAEREVMELWCSKFGAQIVDRGETYCALRIGGART